MTTLTRAFCSLAILTAIPALPAGAARSDSATNDARLADQSPLIIEGRITSRDDSPRWIQPSTDYLINVERVLKGEPVASTIQVRVPGGLRPDGIGLWVPGSPRFREGERVLLFLNPAADGSYQVSRLGAFHRVEAGGRAYWLRDLGTAREPFPPREDHPAPGDRPRVADLFSSWLEERANGIARPADYLPAPAGTLRQVVDNFNLHTGNPAGLNLRWFEFDTGQAVHWRSESKGQSGVAGGGHAEFQHALAAWNADKASNVNFVYDGTIESTGSFDRPTGQNTIAFDTSVFPWGNCGAGAHVENDIDKDAVGNFAFWFDTNQSRMYKGRPVYAIYEAHVSTNIGISCLFGELPNDSSRSAYAEEMFGHQLGHVLGIADSCFDCSQASPEAREALMAWRMHTDGRGTRLNSDDQAALQQLYGAATSGGGPCKADSTTLCLQKNRFKVQAVFQNQFNDTGGAARAIKSTDLAGFFYFYDKSNFELMIKILDFGDVVKVFYGQLTNLHFTITVTDTKTGSVKSYQNTAGECGGIDQTAFAPSSTAPPATIPLRSLPAAATTCKAGRNTLCLLGGRFKAEVDWRNQYNGASGHGGVVRASDVTGLVWFTDPSNIELIVKMLDFGGQVKLFYGALSDLEYTLRVTDMASGATKSYFNPAGRFCGGIDDNLNALTGSATSWNLTHRFVSVTGPDNCWVREQRERLTSTWAVVANQPMSVTRENAAIGIDAEFEIGTPYTFVGTVNGAAVSATDDRPAGGGACRDGSQFEQRSGVANLAGRFTANDREFTGTVVNSYQLTSGGEVKYTWDWNATRTD